MQRLTIPSASHAVKALRVALDPPRGAGAVSPRVGRVVSADRGSLPPDRERELQIRRAASEAARGLPPRAGARPLRRRHPALRDAPRRLRALASRARARWRDRHDARVPHPGRPRRRHGRRPRRGGRHALGHHGRGDVPGDGLAGPGARSRPLRGRGGGGRGRRRSLRGRGRRRPRGGVVRAAGRDDRHRCGPRGRCPAAARGLARQRADAHPRRRGGRGRRLRRCTDHDLRDLHLRGGDRRAARGPRLLGRPRRRHRRAHALVVPPDAPRAALPRRRAPRPPRAPPPRDLPRHGRRLRDQDTPLPGGPRRGLARAATPAAGEVGADAARGLPGEQLLPRPPDRRGRRRRRRRPAARPAGANPHERGCLLDPARLRLDARGHGRGPPDPGPIPDPRLRVRGELRRHQQGPPRRVPRGGHGDDHVLDGAGDGPPRQAHGARPRRGAAAEPHQRRGFPVPQRPRRGVRERRAFRRA